MTSGGLLGLPLPPAPPDCPNGHGAMQPFIADMALPVVPPYPVREVHSELTGVQPYLEAIPTHLPLQVYVCLTCKLVQFYAK